MTAHHTLRRRALLQSAGAVGMAAALPQQGAWAKAAPYAAARAVLSSLVRNGALPGAMGSVGIKASPEILSTGSIDFERQAAPHAHTLWRIYSMTKPILGIAAMILVDQGKLRLDQPLADIIPAFAKPMVLVDPKNSLDVAPAKSIMTIGQLMTHTSGMASMFQDTGPILGEIAHTGLGTGGRRWRNQPASEAPVQGLEDAVARLAKLPLSYEPGTQWRYSFGLDVLGRVLEIVEGKPFPDVLRERLFEPLGMNETYFQAPANRAKDIAAIYTFQDGKPVALDKGPDSVYLEAPAFPSGGGGLLCSAHDYDRFLAMLVNEGALGKNRVMSAETARLAMSDMLPASIDRKSIIVPGCYGFGAAGALGGMGLSKDCFTWFGLGGTIGWADKANKIRGAFWVQYLMTSTQISPQADYIRALYSDLDSV
jgi:CubicO group peptidase (beta-lactamase class C family)